MNEQAIEGWMQALGYDPASHSMQHPNPRLQTRHPFAPELHDLLNPNGEIRAQAVFDVEGVPTVCFFSDDGLLLDDAAKMDAIRQRIWNQNLISLILVLQADRVVPVPVTRKVQAATPLARADARSDGPLSRADVQSGDLWARYKTWFRIEDRVDRKLLENLRMVVRRLSDFGKSRRSSSHFSLEDAQYLVAQILFVSY